MKSIFMIMIAALITAAIAAPVALHAEEKKEMEKKVEIPEGFKAQTTCPVMGGKITSTSYTDYQGQRIYFCCPGCEGSFLEDPDKYFETAAEDSILFENVQTTCPVTGEPINRKSFTYHKGRGIYFCCAGCIEKFKADPDKYLEMMDKAEDKGKKKCDKDHEHDH